VETWRGVYPITSFVLDALRKKKDDATAHAELTDIEQTLLIACDFWAAAAHGTLDEYLAVLPVARLKAARSAFATIGAVRVASDLRLAIVDLERSSSPAAVAKIIARLDERLARTEDQVDHLIAQFAAERYPHAVEWA
jgi:hypothetical protein